MRSHLIVRRSLPTRTVVRRAVPRARWRDPFFGHSALVRDMDRLFDSLWADMARWPAPPTRPVAPSRVRSTEDGVDLLVGLEGFEASDIEVTVEEDTVVITGDTARRDDHDDADADVVQATTTAEPAAEASVEADTDDADAEETTTVTAAEDTDGTLAAPVERRTFRRAWRLDADRYDLERIEASVDEGVLTVRVPRQPRPEPRRVEVRW